ncbi:MAG: DUF1800 family protein [Opitutaceae bacterium]|nr:DUF1800 family protein [Opitutaceae bacterium]
MKHRLHWLAFLFGAISVWAQPGDERLLNLSSRGFVGTESEVFVAGFVISEGASKQVLIRAIGPTLADYGIPGVLIDPELKLYDSSNNLIATNDNWTSTAEATFGTVGAFALPAGSRDAAMVVTLEPGVYSAHAAGLGADANGEGMIEIYDLSGASQLLNLSTRGRIESNRSLVISGFVVAPGAESRRLLVRAVGPTLSNYGVENALSDPAIAVVRAIDAVQIASNDDWETFANPESLEAIFQTVGAFALERGSKDAVALIELAPGAYTMQVSGVGDSAGISLVEVYDLIQVGAPGVSVAASVATTDTEASTPPGEFTITRTGDVSRSLTVDLEFGGSAVMGTDFVNVPSTVTFAAGESSAKISIQTYANTVSTQSSKTVNLSVKPGSGYLPGTHPSATVAIVLVPGELFLGNMRPAAGIVSTAFGSISIQLAADGSTSLINMSFAGLSSPQTVAYLRMGVPGDNGPDLLRLPNGQVVNARWDFNAAGGLTSAELVTALREGRIYVSIETANFPAGEIASSLVLNTGSVEFQPPPAVPVAADEIADDTQAARFLTQATFGPIRTDIDRLKSIGVNAWIDEQMAKPISYLSADTVAEWEAVPANGRGNNNARPGFYHRNSAWFKDVMNGEDQLRQRVAFALSQIFVISIENTQLLNWENGVTAYHDVLMDHAFGDFRALLEKVTLQPSMGLYLSHLRNAKADPETGSLPDENYAREVMQLFTIGLNELQPDGTLKLNDRGLPIATYTNETIQETAKVFTGWTFASANPNNDNQFRRSARDDVTPMILFPQFHDDSEKTIVTGRVLPAGQGGVADLRDTLDTLFEHPNTGPFIARRLIQRMVTSNPSPGYVYRVAQKFADNGSGQRGDLGAVVRAILTDYEARSSEIAASGSFGKLKEPLLRLTGLFRLLPVSAADGRLDIRGMEGLLAQEPMRAPSVFNYFEPNFTRPGAIAGAGLYAPEFQILTDTTAITTANMYYNHIYGSPGGVSMNFSSILGMANDADQLIALLNLHLAANQFSADTIAKLKAAHTDLMGTTSAINRVRAMVHLAMAIPDAAVQR